MAPDFFLSPPGLSTHYVNLLTDNHKSDKLESVGLSLSPDSCLNGEEKVRERVCLSCAQEGTRNNFLKQSVTYKKHCKWQCSVIVISKLKFIFQIVVIHRHIGKQTE